MNKIASIIAFAMASNAVNLNAEFHPDQYVDYFHSTTVEDMRGAFLKVVKDKKAESE